MPKLRFGVFELDVDPPALRRRGVAVPLPAQSLRLLVHLAQRPFVLFAHGPSLWVRWPGYERDPAVLDLALAALVGLARDRP